MSVSLRGSDSRATGMATKIGVACAALAALLAFLAPAAATARSSSTPGSLSTPASSTSVAPATLAAGGFHTCAITGAGGLKCWGDNISGQLGDNQNCGFFCFTPIDVSGLASGVPAVAAGDQHSCALTSGGGVKCWGYNGVGGLGDGTTINRLTPVDVSGLAAGVANVAAGGFHTCALTTTGGSKCWGWNRFGQLGDGTTNNSSTAVDVFGLTSGTATISAGGRHTCARTDSAELRCWGQNGFGQLGDGQSCGVICPTPVDVIGSWPPPPPPNQEPDCSAVTGTPNSIWPATRDQMVLITLAGATDPDGDPLSYQIDGVTQDEYVTGVGDDTSPDAALTAAGTDSDQVFLRTEANPQFNGRVYRIAYTVSDGQGGNCSETAGTAGTTTAKVSVPRKKGMPALDDGNATSWDSFTGAPVQ